MSRTRWVSAWLVLQVFGASSVRADEPVPVPASSVPSAGVEAPAAAPLVSAEPDAPCAEIGRLRLQVEALVNDVVRSRQHALWLVEKRAELDALTYTRSIVFLASGGAAAIATGFVFVGAPEAIPPGTVLGLVAAATIATGVVLAARTRRARREIRRVIDASERRLLMTPVLGVRQAGVSVAVRF